MSLFADVSCPRCGKSVAGIVGEVDEVILLTCPACGVEIEHRFEIPEDRRGGGRFYVTRMRDAPDDPVAAEEEDEITTQFHPQALVDPRLDRGQETDWGDFARAREASSERAERPPPAAVAWLEIPGAPPEAGRIVLRSAHTTFGRLRADVVLADREVSARHFQIDVRGKEFFVRDLDSPNGTWLNGHRVRHSELLPGDEIRAGGTVLVFRRQGS